MATLNEVKGRIQGVKNTQKITRAMKIVAATKLKARERDERHAKPFADKTKEAVMDILTYGDASGYMMLTPREEIKSVGIIIIGSNRGLCGAFNNNLFRKAVETIEKEQKIHNVSLFLLGTRTVKFFKKINTNVVLAQEDYEQEDRFKLSAHVMEQVVKAYCEGTIDACYVLRNAFISKSTYEFTKSDLVPVTLASEEERTDSLYLFEDGVHAVLDFIIPRYLAVQLSQMIIESQRAEELSRMLAMDYATENAQELIGDLTLLYNRTRQSVITKELAEIVGGAEALK